MSFITAWRLLSEGRRLSIVNPMLTAVRCTVKSNETHNLEQVLGNIETGKTLVSIFVDATNLSYLKFAPPC